MTTNGEWSEMKRLVLARMDDHSKKLDKLSASVVDLKTQMAVMADRDSRAAHEAKGIAVRWGSGIGAIVSTVISATLDAIRHP
jgi:hypothetical protein